MKLSKPTFVVSTWADDLTEALKKSPQTITIWIRSGKYKNKFPIIRSAVTYEAKSGVDAKDYKKRFVSAFPIPKTHTRLSVLKGISANQITQLLSYTKKDRVIRTSTHDIDYFKNKKTFKSWKARRKTIYTLIGKNGKLFAIIWYHKGIRSTRIYLPARDKNVDRKFQNIVRENYVANNPKSTVSKYR